MKFYYGNLQQYIDMSSIFQYIDDLKTRIYKAFYQKSRSQAYHLQLFCANSPIVILMTTKSSIEAANQFFDLFESGYLIFSLSNNFYVDTSFYAYYRENIFVDASYLFGSLIEKAKCASAILSIEPYQAYLFHKVNFIFYRFKNSHNLNSIIFNEASILKYGICFDLESCFSYLYIHGLIKKLSINQSIKSHILKYLSYPRFNYLISYFSFLSEHAVLLSSIEQLPMKLLSMFAYFICIDIYNAFNALNRYKSSFLFTGYNFVLIILGQDCLELNLLAKELNIFLRFNGVKLIHGLRAYLAPLLNGMTCKLLSISATSNIYPFYLVIQPSLFSQFGLMRRISFMLFYSVSQPLFLLIIRLNKLMLFWAHIYLSCNTGRTFYLVDYLVYLKIRLFVKKHCFFKRDLCSSLFLKFNSNKSTIALNKLNDSLVESIFTDRRYRHYVSVRMFWIYALKCLSI